MIVIGGRGGNMNYTIELDKCELATLKSLVKEVKQ
jgi:hypothetical protein